MASTLTDRTLTNDHALHPAATHLYPQQSPIIKLAMPALGATDPANLEAQVCAELGLSWLLKQPRQTSPHPALGGSGGYAQWFHEE